MTKVRKQRRKKKYQYNVNRKRMNKKRLPALESKTIKESWNKRISSNRNFSEMGLMFDVNQDVKLFNTENINETNTVRKIKEPVRKSVVEELEEDANAPREKCYRLPKHQVEYLIYLLEKYGDDYKAMTKDKKNYLQQTWKQLRSKINTFKSIPEQYNEYLRKKNINEINE